MKLTCIIIDDEKLARTRIENLVNSVSQLEIIAMCKTGKEAIKAINSKSPDIIFIDIQMKDMTGFDVLSNIDNKMPVVIFVTAYNKYAVKAFDIFAFDYLLKPYTRERFNKSINKILGHFRDKTDANIDKKIESLLNHIKENKEDVNKNIFSNKISIKINNSITFIETSDIKYILASGSYVEIFTLDKKYIHRISLQNIMDAVYDKNLIRIHRSTIVNLKYLDKIVYSNHNDIDLKMKDGNLFRISKSYKKDFQNAVGI